MDERTENRREYKPDELDLEIIAIYSSTPNCTLKIVSEQTGVCIATVWNRLQAIRKCDWFQDATARAQGLAEKALARVEKEIDADTNAAGHSVALSLLRGIRVLADKSEVEQRNLPATVDDIANAIGNLGTAELERLNAKLADAGVVGASSSAVVDGNQPPPDASGSGA